MTSRLPTASLAKLCAVATELGLLIDEPAHGRYEVEALCLPGRHFVAGTHSLLVIAYPPETPAEARAALIDAIKTEATEPCDCEECLPPTPPDERLIAAVPELLAAVPGCPACEVSPLAPDSIAAAIARANGELQ